MKLRVVAVVLVSLGMSLTARANSNDLHLLNFVTKTANPQTGGFIYTQNSDMFNQLAEIMGHIIAPRVLAPGDTLGAWGIEVAYEQAFVHLNASNAALAAAVEDGSPDSFMLLPAIRFRKGLPFSLELGATFTAIKASEMYTLGVDLRFAPIEGYYAAPDFAIRASGTRLIGSRDLDLTTVSLDFTIGKRFAVGGVMTMAPYGGYQVLLIIASSKVIDPTPSDASDTGNDFAFPFPGLAIGHRGFVGMRLNWRWLTFVAEALIGTAEVQTYSFKLGFNL
ncbi:MAG: hypothetical protein HYY84_00080 [Deltaproteobacteria bacterium]|nr:hypothetical protein [Deltaproteobacteria bacterium]